MSKPGFMVSKVSDGEIRVAETIRQVRSIFLDMPGIAIKNGEDSVKKLIELNDFIKELHKEDDNV